MDYNVLTQYIKPELTILVVALYLIGVALKKSKFIADELIPLILGTLSVISCAVYVLSVSTTPHGYQEILGIVFDIFIQGIFCAAASVYVNQMYKQLGKLNKLDNNDAEGE